MKKNVILFLCIVLMLLLYIISKSFRDEKDNKNIETVHYTQFPIELSIESNSFVIKGEDLRFPYRIRQKGDYIYIMDLHGETNFCHILEKEEMRHVASFAKRGIGPEEVLQAMNIHVVSQDSIWLYDTNKREITLWRYSNELSSVILKDYINLNDKLVSSSNCTWGYDSVFFFTDNTGNNRILMMNKEGEIIKRIGNIPINKTIEKNILGSVAQGWNSFIDYNSRNNILAAVTQLGEVLEIYYLNTNKRQVIIGPHAAPKFGITKEGYTVPRGIMGYSDIKITDNYIYAVFHGRTFKDIIKYQDDILDGGEFIHVFTHEGKPVCRLNLDHAIYGIDIDEEQGLIWATDVNSEEQIVLYEIPKQLL